MVQVVPLTSTIRGYRSEMTVEPGAANGLTATSEARCQHILERMGEPILVLAGLYLRDRVGLDAEAWVPRIEPPVDVDPDCQGVRPKPRCGHDGGWNAFRPKARTMPHCHHLLANCGRPHLPGRPFVTSWVTNRFERSAGLAMKGLVLCVTSGGWSGRP